MICHFPRKSYAHIQHDIPNSVPHTTGASQAETEQQRSVYASGTFLDDF